MEDRSYLPKGYQLHQYIIERVLGAGGFGVTYLAGHVSLDSQFVIKEFFPKEFVSREYGYSIIPHSDATKIDYEHFLKKFVAEAKILSSIRHQNVVRVFDYFEANNTAYYVMDYIEGSSLKEYINQNAPLSENETKLIIKPLLEGLKEVHKKNYIHRDIAPDNIFLKSDGIPMLIDFGTVKNVTVNKNSSSIALVKRGYSPPEQYFSDVIHTKAVDIYALGATILTMLTAKIPPESTHRQSFILSKKDDPLDNLLKEIRSERKENLIFIIKKTMNIVAEERYQSIDELEYDLFISNDKEVQTVEAEKKEFPREEHPKRQTLGSVAISIVKWILILLGTLFIIGLAVAIMDDSTNQDINDTDNHRAIEDNITTPLMDNSSPTNKKEISQEVVENISQEEIRSFYQAFSSNGCFANEFAVQNYYATNIIQYFQVSYPTHREIYENNYNICQGKIWTEDTTNMDIRVIQSNPNGVVADISTDYKLIHAEGKKNNNFEFGKVSYRIGFIKENGLVKINFIENRVYNKISDDYKKYAYSLFTGYNDENAINYVDCLINTNQDIIFCLKDRSICKTLDELKSYQSGM